MRNIVQYISWALSLGLNILVLRELLRGLYKSLPFLFAYCVALFLSTVVEIAAFTDPALAESARLYYWVDDAIRQTLLFCLVISLVCQSVAQVERRRVVGRWLVLGSILLSALSVAVHGRNGGLMSRWMTEVIRDVSFCAAILDVMLWSLLIASRNKNRLLLMLSGALGIQFTAQAAGHGLRQVSGQIRSRSLMWAGNICVLLANLICLFVWWRATRRARVAPPLASDARPVKSLPRDP